MAASEVTVTASVAGRTGEAGWTTTVADPGKLAAASWWFCQMLEGPYREAREGVIRVEAADADELDWLRQLVEGRFDDDDLAAYPEALPELVRLYLVAHKYHFEAVMAACRGAIVWADVEDADELAGVLMAIPEALYMDPEVQRLLTRVAKRLWAAWGPHEKYLWDDAEWTGESLAAVKLGELTAPTARFLHLPPHALALVIRARYGADLYHDSMDNALYKMIQGYVSHSPHGGDGEDETTALDAYRVLVEALLSPQCYLTRDFVCLVVSACPYAQQSGLLPRIVAAGLACGLASYGAAAETYATDVQATLDLSSLLEFKPGDRRYVWLGFHRGLPLFLCVTRASVPVFGDKFALLLLVMGEGSLGQHLTRGVESFTTHERFVIRGQLNGQAPMDEVDYITTCLARALVFVEGEEVQTPRTMALLYRVVANMAVGLHPTAAWGEVVREGSPHFDKDGKMTLFLRVE